MWRLANSISTLRDQINAQYPGRNKASDGTIGDAAHQRQGAASDHNPWVQRYGMGVVTAIDITHDPGHGLDIQALGDTLFLNRDSRIKYIIRNRQICVQAAGWRWMPYNGADPHTNHIHISVSADPDQYDDNRQWKIKREEYMNQDDVAHMYRVVLGREADPGGLTGYTNQKWRDVFYQFTSSLEYRLRMDKINASLPPIADTDSEFNRWNKLFVQIRGRNASRDEFRAAAVNRTWLAAMEILSDNPEADAATNAPINGNEIVKQLDAENAELKKKLELLDDFYNENKVDEPEKLEVPGKPKAGIIDKLLMLLFGRFVKETKQPDVTP